MKASVETPIPRIYPAYNKKGGIEPVIDIENPFRCESIRKKNSRDSAKTKKNNKGLT